MTKTCATCALIALFALGCSSDEKVDEPDSGGGNAGQDSGSGATGGSKTDASTGGTGAGGSSGAGAFGGASGDAGAGDAADASDWPDVVCKDEFYSTCSFAETCPLVSCGQATSQVDKNGCRRPACLKDTDCASDERCLPSPLAVQGCLPSQIAGCEKYPPSFGSVCQCTTSSDCGGFIRCVPEALAPEANDCTPAANPNCSTLMDHLGAITNQATVSGLAPELVQKLNDCKAKVEAQIAAKNCP